MLLILVIKAEQVIPVRSAEPVVRVDVPEAAMSPIVKVAEPEPGRPRNTRRRTIQP